MSYDVSFRVKAEGIDYWIDTGYCDANITWNLREMIMASTGLDWKNCENNGLCKDIMPAITKGYSELVNHSEKYKQYESPNGWGTIGGCIGFFKNIIDCWMMLKCDAEELTDVVCFWID